MSVLVLVGFLLATAGTAAFSLVGAVPLETAAAWLYGSVFLGLAVVAGADMVAQAWERRPMRGRR